jgi:hypothetical protein
MCFDRARIAALEQRLAEKLPGDRFFSAISLNCRIAPK